MFKCRGPGDGPLFKLCWLVFWPFFSPSEPPTHFELMTHKMEFIGELKTWEVQKERKINVFGFIKKNF
jgi:hypothetical protein